MKSSIAFLLLVFISVQTAFSQQTNNKKPQKQKSTKTRVKEKGYKLNATIELGFLGVFDHKIQFGLPNNNYSPTYFDYVKDAVSSQDPLKK